MCSPVVNLKTYTFKGPVIPFGSMIEYHPVSARDVRVVNIETITDAQSWHKIWRLNGFQAYPCKKKITGNGEELTKVPRAVRKATSHLHWQFFAIWQSL